MSYEEASGFDVVACERPRIVAAAERYLLERPITITASSSPRSAGGKHDYFSEGEYWWPDPDDPEGPFVRRDGLSNPENFAGHRKALRRFSVQMPALTAAWLMTGESRYADHAATHLRAWFLHPETLMDPHLVYSQAIQGRCTGRHFGVLDGAHLVEVARATRVLEGAGALSAEEQNGVRSWFSDYLRWLTTHAYGRAESKSLNNHGTCWLAQVAEYARLTDDERIVRSCRKRFKKLLSEQLAADGSFPRELERTKPYAYSLFNLDALAIVCQSLSTPRENLWELELRDGRGLGRALAFVYPFVLDKQAWPYEPDVMFWEHRPLRHPSLLLGGLGLHQPEYVALWERLDAPADDVALNYPFRQPVLWLDSAAAR